MSVLERRADEIGEFLAAHGGPFFELQRRLGALEEDALHAGRRALIFIALAWGVPLVLSVLQGHAFGPPDTGPYLLDFSALARFFIATGLFLLAEQQVESGLRGKLAGFVRAPILAPESFAPAARAVVRSLKLRDSVAAEIVCLALAVGMAINWMFHLFAADESGWAAQVSDAGAHVTLPGWWSVAVSVPLFNFLLFRGLWRYLVWAMLLWRIASLKMRLVATHPDGKGGLGFIADYPNAYSTFVLGLSASMAMIVVRHVFDRNISSVTFGYILAGWLAIVFALFAFPLLAFSRPLAELKDKSVEAYGAAATRFHRAGERSVLGRNVVANDAAENADGAGADPSPQFLAARKLSVLLMNRSAIAPLAVCALAPFAIAGATRLPYKEVFALVKKLLIL